MIKGRIITHKEPEKAVHNTRQYWNSDYDDLDLTGYSLDLNTSTVETWAEKDAALMKMINEGVLNGLIIGARVKRKNGSEIPGTIIHIHRSHSMAWNYSSKTIEPFKVTWDRVTGSTGGTFDYQPSALIAMPIEKHLPALLEQIKGENNETLLHLC